MNKAKLLNNEVTKIPDWIYDIKEPRAKNQIIIPIYAPMLSGNENRYVKQCLDTEWLSSKGEFVEKFEQSFARYCGVKYAVACSSGTAAIFLALVVMGITKGDEVIVPTFTMISTAFAVSYTGAKPVFVDCEENTGNIDTTKIEQAVTKKTKAIIPVHIYGNPCNMAEMHRIADKYHLQVLEDAAEAFGSEYQGHKIGGVSPLNAFSLYANKVITTGEGGMITLKSRTLYKKLKRLNNYYFSDKRHFWHEGIGYNYRLSNLQAAVGLAQIEKAETILKNKIRIAGWYREYLSPIKEYFDELENTPGCQSNYWCIAYRIKNNKIKVADLRTKLRRAGIETRSFFIPLHLQPVYCRAKKANKFPNAERLAKTGVLLPSGPKLSQAEVKNICNMVKDCFYGQDAKLSISTNGRS
jgi:perosamine synthetase